MNDADWRRYWTCPACNARAGQPCVNLNSQRSGKKAETARPHARREVALTWTPSEKIAGIWLPDCERCNLMMHNPVFVDAVFTVTARRGAFISPMRRARNALNHWHHDGHPDDRHPAEADHATPQPPPPRGKRRR